MPIELHLKPTFYQAQSNIDREEVECFLGSADTRSPKFGTVVKPSLWFSINKGHHLSPVKLCIPMET